MEKSLVVQHNQVDSFSDIENRVQKIKEFLTTNQSKAENTVKGYCSDWNDFQTWCMSFPEPFESLPVDPPNLAAYLVELANGERGKQIIREIGAKNQERRLRGEREVKVNRLHRLVAENGHKVSVIQRRLAAITRAHIMAGFPSPAENATIIDTMDKIRRAKGVRQDGKAPILLVDIKKIIETMPPGTNKTARDRAIILVGFAGAFRRSELVALNVEDVEPAPKGLIIRIRKSKTDQTGEGQEIAIFNGANKDTCPIAALKSWIAHVGSGPIFRPIDRHDNIKPDRMTAHAVATIIKDAVEKAGYNKDRFSGHSLRAGFVTQADINGASDRAIQKVTRHKTSKMIGKYSRDADLFRNSAGENIGL